MEKKTRPINYPEFIRRVEKRNIDPVYFFIGEENYLKEEGLCKLKKILFSPEIEVFNYELFREEEIESVNLLDSLQTLPFMAEKKLVVIRGVEKLSSSTQELLVSYLEKPLDSTCLILLADKPDARKNFFSILTEKAINVNFRPFDRSQVTAWIGDYFRRHGKEIKPEVASNLWEMVGNNLTLLSQEIEKIITYVGEKKKLVWTDVEPVVTGVNLVNIFGLVEAVGKKEMERALSFLSCIFQTREGPLAIVGMLARQWRLIWEAKQGSSLKMVSSAWSRGPSLVEQSQRFTTSELRRGFHLLLECDSDIKSTGSHPRLILEQLIINLCQK